MNLEQDPVYSLLKVLNENNLRVLCIDDEYFAVTDFYPSDRNVPYHKIIGKHITKVVIDYLNTGLQGQQLHSVLQQIEALKDREIDYSEKYDWKLMIK